MKMKKFLKLIKNRYFIMTIIITMLFAVLGFRLAYLTVDMGEYYYNMAQERKMIEVTLKGARGNILDRNGIPLAVNRQIYVAQVDRKWLPSKDEEINQVLYETIKIIEQNGDVLLDNIPIKSGVKVYEDIVPYAADGFYYDFGTTDASVHEKRYDAWRKEANIKADLPADMMLALLRERYKIDESIPDEAARKIISIRLDLYLNRFRQDEPVKIAEDINNRTVSHIETYANELRGIQTVIELGRYYPYGTSAQHIIGYVGRMTSNNIESYKNEYGRSPEEDGYNIYSDKYGQDGMEAYAEKWLTGNTNDKHGWLKAEVDASRRVIQVLDEKVPQNGNDVTLTIDIRLQRLTENILEEELYKMREGLPPYDDDDQAPLAHTGAAVILDVHTGEILTMASYANSQYTYDLNDFARGITTTEYNNLSRDPSNPLFAIAFQGGMEPGSVFKMLVGTAALMEGKVGIEETIRDGYRLRPSAPACWSSYGHGSVNIMDALKVSCNYYFTAIGDRLGIEDLHKWAMNFGLHGSTGLELLNYNGKIDRNVVANPELVEDNRRKAAAVSVKILMRDKYNKVLTDEEVKELVDIDLQYSKLVNYLRDHGHFDAKDGTVHDAANDLLNIFYQGRWSDWEFLRVFIGQSATSVSPLAVARYIATLVNGSRVLDTHIMKEVRSSEGELIQQTVPEYTKLDVREDVAAAIKEGMRRVVYQKGGPGGNGTAVRVFEDMDPSITLGGKTGTAQVVPGLVERNTAWFTAFTPYEEPEIAVVVAIPNGKASGNAAPIARRIIEEYYRIMNREQYNTLSVPNGLSQ
jgi:penicillin-binding protein 2